MAAADYDHLVKLLLLGDSAVGKSSLLMRFCDDRFETNHVLTIGVDFKFKRVERNGRKLKLQVWDTAGQERFRTITPAYYHAAMGVVLTYDITDKNSFDHVEYWVTQLNQHGSEDVQRILVGNKADMAAELDAATGLPLRKVTEEAGRNLAEKFNMAFFETSAKTGQNVENAFQQIADNVVEKRYKNAPAGGPGGDDLLRPKPKKKGCC